MRPWKVLFAAMLVTGAAPGTAGGAGAVPAQQPGDVVTLTITSPIGNPPVVRPGEALEFTGSCLFNSSPTESVSIYGYRPITQPGMEPSGSFLHPTPTPNPDGTYAGEFTVPPTALPGAYVLSSGCYSGDVGLRGAQTDFTVAGDPIPIPTTTTTTTTTTAAAIVTMVPAPTTTTTLPSTVPTTAHTSLLTTMVPAPSTAPPSTDAMRPGDLSTTSLVGGASSTSPTTTSVTAGGATITGSTTGSTTGSVLARTGVDATTWTFVGFGLFTVGAAFVLVNRRARNR